MRDPAMSVVIVVMALISLTTTWWNMSFPRTAGAEISGHRLEQPAE